MRAQPMQMEITLVKSYEDQCFKEKLNAIHNLRKINSDKKENKA
jgi:hypothetical protein